MSMTNFINSNSVPKQFLPSEREIDMPADWTKTRFADRYLHKSPELPITRIERPREDNRAHGLQRLRFLKKEIMANLPVGTKTALRTLMTR
jgi:hypothetical protein